MTGHIVSFKVRQLSINVAILILLLQKCISRIVKYISDPFIYRVSFNVFEYTTSFLPLQYSSNQRKTTFCFYWSCLSLNNF